MSVQARVPLGRLREWTRSERILEDVRGEISFAEMTDAVGSVLGLLELLHHTVDAVDRGHTDAVAWNRIGYSVNVALRRLDCVYAAVNRLELLDRRPLPSDPQT